VAQISRKLRNAAGPSLMFWCPGCNEPHRVTISQGGGSGWTWNNDAERPVFSPSVLVTGHDFTVKGRADYEAWYADGCQRGESAPHKFESMDTRCHSFVGCNGAAPGQIVFLGDCTHSKANSVMDLPDWPESYLKELT
jgi:hypothetical protein